MNVLTYERVSLQVRGTAPRPLKIASPVVFNPQLHSSRYQPHFIKKEEVDIHQNDTKPQGRQISGVEGQYPELEVILS